MRIVGGRLGGRPLKGPSSDRIRPTSDRLRESLFNILEHGYGGIADMRVIDLFAGTGALALEALSRGARFALLVDDGSEARAAIRDNVESLGLGGATRIYRRDARKLGPAPAGEPFDLAFLDPPYGKGFAEPALASLRDGGWLRPGALAIVEETANEPLVIPIGYARQEMRVFGDTQVLILKTEGGQTDQPVAATERA
jgi:16S rRNA (guanine966-N2)-methyltransferase